MIKKVFRTAITNSFSDWQRPTHLILHVTSSCNARCGMCFAWRRLNKKKDDLTLTEIKKIARSLPGLTFLDISGGEPFLREDLAEILGAFGRFSPEAYINLPTNGLLTEKIIETTTKILKEVKLPLSLNLSLDGLAKTHDRIRGIKGCFAQMQKTYRALVFLKEKYPRLSLKVATVVSNQNFNELGDLAKFVKNKMPAIDFHTLILIRGEPRNSVFALPPLKELEKKKKLFFEIWNSYGYGKNLGNFGDRVGNVAHRYLLGEYLKTLREKKMPWPCLAGRAHAVIYANTDVSLCELRTPVGNLRRFNFNFAKLWNSHEAQRQRQAISQNSCFCTHGCNWTDNLFLNPKVYPRLAWEMVKALY